jgi:hypothetical protein
MEENERVIANGGRPAKGLPLLLGITKASLSTDSFISAASLFSARGPTPTRTLVRSHSREPQALQETHARAHRRIDLGQGGAVLAQALRRPGHLRREGELRAEWSRRRSAGAMERAWRGAGDPAIQIRWAA